MFFFEKKFLQKSQEMFPFGILQTNPSLCWLARHRRRFSNAVNSHTQPISRETLIGEVLLPQTCGPLLN